jgi:hypothetical protein
VPPFWAFNKNMDRNHNRTVSLFFSYFSRLPMQLPYFISSVPR